MRYVQSADIIFLAHPSYHPKKLTRSSHYEWTFANINYSVQQAAPTGISASPSGFESSTSKTVYYKVTAVNAETGEESLPSSAASVSISLPWPSGAYVQVSWSAASGASCYYVYKNYRGSYGFIGRTTSTTFMDDYITQDDTITPPEENTPFESAGNYPGAVGIFQQRMIFGRTNNQPQTVFMSKTGLFSNFSSSIPLQDTDSIEATMASRQVNEILHFVPLTVLVALTTGGEWIVSNGDNSDALTPTSTQFKPQGYRGASTVSPLVIGNSVLYLQRGGRTVRDMYYQLESDSYTGNNLTVIAGHLLRNYKITDWTYQQEPDSIVWAVRSDGKLLSFTYLRGHQVWAWAMHETDGEFESIASIPGTNDGDDEVYFIVKRTINGETVRCIEKLMTRLPAEVLEDAFFVDCGLTYNDDAATQISGLGHLEGCAVSVLADGNVIPAMTVSGGSITLPQAASKVHVGLAYESLVETLDIDLAQVDAAQGQGRKKRVVSLVVRIDNSRGIWAGPDEDKLTEMKFRTDEGWNEATRLFTGDKKIVLEALWKTNGQIVIKQQYPLPLTILAIIPEFAIGS